MTYKYKFEFSKTSENIETDDPNIWMKKWRATTREQIYLYELFYYDEVILFSAQRSYEVDEEENCTWVDWELQFVGRAWGNEHESYEFNGPISRQEATDIIMDFLWQNNGRYNRGNSKVRSASISKYLQKNLDEDAATNKKGVLQ
ncbi:MAG: hypothetical protein JJ964_10870 [Rhizobiales bacterium]|nr:hypothetical protein [Hyphomicrobiales bacterium]